MKPFESDEQFRQVIEQIFRLMNDHPEVGPKLNRAQAPHLFEFPDLGLRFHVTYTEPAEAEAPAEPDPAEGAEDAEEEKAE